MPKPIRYIAVDDSQFGQGWTICLMGGDFDGKSYCVETYNTHASEYSHATNGAKSDAEKIARFLNNTGRRSDPWMNEEMIAIANAFDKHLMLKHNADFEVCQDDLCHTASLLEKALGWINEDGTYNEEMQ